MVTCRRSWSAGRTGLRRCAVVHPDGSEAVSTSTINPDGSSVRRLVTEDGSVTTTTERTTPDGHDHKTIEHPDGTTESFETFGEVRPDGSSFVTSIGLSGTETINYAARMARSTRSRPMQTARPRRTSSLRIPMGRWSKQKREPMERRGENHYESKSLDGSYTTVTRDFDGVETRTTMDENGRISVRELQTDGTSTETDYNPDGSGSTVTIDAAGNVTGESTIDPVPPPVPREFEPDKFLSSMSANCRRTSVAPSPWEPSRSLPFLPMQKSMFFRSAVSHRSVTLPPPISTTLLSAQRSRGQRRLKGAG